MGGEEGSDRSTLDSDDGVECNPSLSNGFSSSKTSICGTRVSDCAEGICRRNETQTCSNAS